MRRAVIGLLFTSALAACAHDRGFDRGSARAIENDTPAASDMPESPTGDELDQDPIQAEGAHHAD